MDRQRFSVFTGSGSFLPTRTIKNEDFIGHEFFLDYGQPLDPTDNPRVVSKFREITEISERRYSTDDLTASDLGFEAAALALADADIDPETLDYIIVAHNFGDVRADNLRLDFCPTLAARVKERLGIQNPSCVAYDLPFGCPGWLQAVIQADYFLRSGDSNRALIVGAETLSRVSDPHDRDSMIYADGAGAVVLEATDSEEPVGILSHATRSDTLEHARLLWMGPSYDPGHPDDRLFLKMYGRKLYSYAIKTVPGAVRDSLNRAGLTLTDVAKVLLHQANAKMDQAILERLFRLYEVEEIPERIMPMTISWLGNSSVATLPTLFDLMRRDTLEGQGFFSGDLVVFASVGAGMNINSLVYRYP
ncbi:MAG: ketoacyl-ACP synthase III [Gemmatimonadetes bacterium]|nr:ketoacyl-ACP synthase III [Gemmatimonadota bacterium]